MASAAAGTPSGPVRAALTGAVLWLLVEFVGRNGFGLLAALFLGIDLRTARAAPSPEVLAGAVLALVPTLALLGWLFYRRARRAGLTLTALGYDASWLAVAAGLLFGLLGLAFDAWIARPLDEVVSPGHHADEALLTQALLGAGWAIVALTAVVNGFLVPLTEEFAWRGYIQRRLVEGWGRGAGIIVTALLFAGKHMVVDFSVLRAPTLVIGAVVLGLVAYRWGTVASTIMHVMGNLGAMLLSAFWAARL